MFEIEINFQEKEKDKNNSENQTVIPGGPLSVLRKVLETVNDLVEEIEIKGKEHGIEIRIVDSMHVVLVDVMLKKEMFNKYRCDRDVSLGIKLKTLVTILKEINPVPDSTFHMSCEDKPEKLFISYINPQYKLEWFVKLVSYELEDIDIPDVQFEAEISASSKEFFVLSKSFGAFGKFLSIEAKKDEAVFKQDGDNASSSMTLKHNEANPNVEIHVTKPTNRMIALKYIDNIAKIAGLTSKIRMCMGDEAPVFFDLSFFDFGHVRYYIAPKMEDS